MHQSGNDREDFDPTTNENVTGEAEVQERGMVVELTVMVDTSQTWEADAICEALVEIIEATMSLQTHEYVMSSKVRPATEED